MVAHARQTFGDLAVLEDLDLSNNHMSGYLMPLTALSHLVHVGLEDNHFMCPLPPVCNTATAKCGECVGRSLDNSTTSNTASTIQPTAANHTIDQPMFHPSAHTMSHTDTTQFNSSATQQQQQHAAAVPTTNGMGSLYSVATLPPDEHKDQPRSLEPTTLQRTSVQPTSAISDDNMAPSQQPAGSQQPAASRQPASADRQQSATSAHGLPANGLPTSANEPLPQSSNPTAESESDVAALHSAVVPVSPAIIPDESEQTNASANGLAVGDVAADRRRDRGVVAIEVGDGWAKWITVIAATGLVLCVLATCFYWRNRERGRVALIRKDMFEEGHLLELMDQTSPETEWDINGWANDREGDKWEMDGTWPRCDQPKDSSSEMRTVL